MVTWWWHRPQGSWEWQAHRQSSLAAHVDDGETSMGGSSDRSQAQTGHTGQLLNRVSCNQHWGQDPKDISPRKMGITGPGLSDAADRRAGQSVPGSRTAWCRICDCQGLTRARDQQVLHAGAAGWSDLHPHLSGERWAQPVQRGSAAWPSSPSQVNNWWRHLRSHGSHEVSWRSWTVWPASDGASSCARWARNKQSMPSSTGLFAWHAAGPRRPTSSPSSGWQSPGSWHWRCVGAAPLWRLRRSSWKTMTRSPNAWAVNLLRQPRNRSTPVRLRLRWRVMARAPQSQEKALDQARTQGQPRLGLGVPLTDLTKRRTNGKDPQDTRTNKPGKRIHGLPIGRRRPSRDSTGSWDRWIPWHPTTLGTLHPAHHQRPR